MNKRLILYILIGICFIMPIISVEGIIPWLVTIFFIHRILKKIKEVEDVKVVVKNTVCCGSIILVYNFLGRWIERILVNLWM